MFLKSYNMKNHWIKKGILFTLCFIAFILALGGLVMWLWNSILPAVLGIQAINYWQALGLFALSRILFGGFHGRGGGRAPWGKNMPDKCASMSAEDKARFKAEWKNRCGGKWQSVPNDSSSSPSSENT